MVCDLSSMIFAVQICTCSRLGSVPKWNP